MSNATASSVRPRGRGRLGLMLIEVLLALAITGMVATAVASLLFAVASGSRDREDLRRHNVRADVLANRLDGAIRSSSMLLGHDPYCLVLWVCDSRKNGKPDLSELRRIEWDPVTKRLQCFQAPADLLPGDDVTYPMTTDFTTATDAVKGTPVFPPEVWGNGVIAWSSNPATAVVRAARMISYSVTVDTPAGRYVAPSSATLRGTSVVER
jgi:type II secretory pathway pseudopilin PulG